MEYDQLGAQSQDQYIGYFVECYLEYPLNLRTQKRLYSRTGESRSDAKCVE